MERLSTATTQEPIHTPKELSEVENVTADRDTDNMLDKEGFSFVSDQTVTVDTFEQKSSTASLHNNLHESSATRDIVVSKEIITGIQQTTDTMVKDAMLTDSKVLQSTNDEGNPVTETIFDNDNDTEETEMDTTTGETRTESSKFTHQMTSDVDTTAEIHWIDVTTQPEPNGRNIVSRAIRKFSKGVPPRFDTNRAVQPRKMIRSLKFRI